MEEVSGEAAYRPPIPAAIQPWDVEKTKVVLALYEHADVHDLKTLSKMSGLPEHNVRAVLNAATRSTCAWNKAFYVRLRPDALDPVLKFDVTLGERDLFAGGALIEPTKGGK